MTNTECLHCGTPVTATATQTTLGHQTGLACDDCAYWCDGNTTPANAPEPR